MSMKKNEGGASNLAPPPPPPVCFSTEGMNPQQFALPRSTMLYMIKAKKSPVLHRKYMRLCKYTYDKNRVVPVCRLDYRRRWNDTSTWSAKYDEQWNKTFIREELDLSKGNFKLWILDSPYLAMFEKTFVILADGGDEVDDNSLISKLLEKTYRFDSDVSIVDQRLTLDEFKFLAASGKQTELRLAYGSVVKNDETVVRIGTILECIPLVKKIEYCFPKSSNLKKSVMMEEVNAIINVLRGTTKIKAVEIDGLPDEFDIDSIESFLMNTNGKEFKLVFAGSLSPDYKNKLENLIVRIIAKCPRNLFSPSGGPVIAFDGQNVVNFNRMY